MPLTVETGANVENANSYNSISDIREYAAVRGFSLPSSDSELEPLSFQAMDYLESKRDRFQGYKSNANQALQFPRLGMIIDGQEFPGNAIPKELKQAQCRLIVELHKGVDIMPTREGAQVKREKVGAIETEYSERVGSVEPTLTAVDALLSPLFKSSFVGMSLQSVRA